MATISLKIKDIRAVAHAMAVNDRRLYLNGILIEHNGIETRIIATNGHRCHAVRVEHPDALVCKPESWVLPTSIVKTICKAKFSRHSTGEVTLTLADGKALALLPDGTEAIATLIDGRFPDWRRVIPTEASGEHSILNPGYVADALAGLADYLGLKKGTDMRYAVKHNGESSAVLASGDFIAVIMPTRDRVSDDPPAFWREDMQMPDVVAVQLPAGFEHLQAETDHANDCARRQLVA